METPRLAVFDREALTRREMPAASMKAHSVALVRSNSRRLPNGQATTRNASRGLPFGSLGDEAGSSTAIRWPMRRVGTVPAQTQCRAPGPPVPRIDAFSNSSEVAGSFISADMASILPITPPRRDGITTDSNKWPSVRWTAFALHGGASKFATPTEPLA